MNLISTPLVDMGPIAMENYRRLLVAATRVNPKGLLDPCYGYALQIVAGMVGYEDLPFGRGSMGRIAKAVLEIRTSEFLSTFVPLRSVSKTQTNTDPVFDLGMECNGTKPTQDPESTAPQQETIIPVGMDEHGEPDITPSIDIPHRVVELATGAGVEMALLVDLWWNENKAYRVAYRSRILRKLDTFAFRCEQGWVHDPNGFFCAMIKKNWMIDRRSPEEIQQRQAQKAQKVTAALQVGNDGEKIRQQVAEGLQEAQKQDIGEGAARIAPDIKQRIVARLEAHEALEPIQVTVLKYAGITLQNPKKYNPEDATMVLQALGA